MSDLFACLAPFPTPGKLGAKQSQEDSLAGAKIFLCLEVSNDENTYHQHLNDWDPFEEIHQWYCCELN